MHLESHYVQLICLFPHDVSPMLHMIFPLLLPKLLECVELLTEGVRSTRLLNFQLCLSHLIGFLFTKKLRNYYGEHYYNLDVQ